MRGSGAAFFFSFARKEKTWEKRKVPVMVHLAFKWHGCGKTLRLGFKSQWGRSNFGVMVPLFFYLPQNGVF